MSALVAVKTMTVLVGLDAKTHRGTEAGDQEPVMKATCQAVTMTTTVKWLVVQAPENKVAELNAADTVEGTAM